MKINSGRLGLVAAMTTMSTILLTAALVTVGIVVYTVISNQVANEATARQNTSLRVAATILANEVQGAEVTWGSDGEVKRIVVSGPLTFEDNAMIDSIGRMTGETTTVFAWDPESRDFWRKTTNIVQADGSRAVGTALGRNGAVYPAIARGETYRGEATILDEPYYTIYQPILSASGEPVGILYAGLRKAQMVAILDNMLSSLSIAFGLILAVAFGATLFLTRKMLRPLTVLAGITRRIADSDLEATVPYALRGDEVGEMAKAVETLKQRSQERFELAAAQDQARNTREEQARKTEMRIAGFRDTVQSLIQSVEDTAKDLEETARSLTGIAGESAARASETAAASEEATGNVETVASAAEELAASITEISRQVGHTTEIVAQASEGAASTNEKVSSLAEAANKIGEVIGLIQDIAEQTNLLALNATIEGRARRRDRQGLRRRRRGSEGACNPDIEGDGRDQGTDHRDPELDAGCRGGDQRNHPDNGQREQLHRRDRGSGGTTGQRDDGNLAQCPGRGARHRGGNRKHGKTVRFGCPHQRIRGDRAERLFGSRRKDRAIATGDQRIPDRGQRGLTEVNAP